MPFSAAISLSLRLLNLSRPDTAMTKSQSNSCVTSFATTEWSCAFLGSLILFLPCKRRRHWPVGLSPLQRRLLHISLHCQRALNLTLLLLHNSTNLPQQEVRLRSDLLQRLQPPLRQKVLLLDLFLPPTPANPLLARPTPLLLPTVALHAPLWGHTLIKELLLRPVKAKALTQGKAKALVPPTLILQIKAKRAKRARKARRVKKVKTPKAKATRGRRAKMPGPSWKVARVPPRVTRNNCFYPFVHPTIFCFIGSSIYTFHPLLPPLSIHLQAFDLLSPLFSCMLIRFLPLTGLSRSFRPTRSFVPSC